MNKVRILVTWLAPLLLLFAATLSWSDEIKHALDLNRDKRFVYAEEQARVRHLIKRKYVRPVEEKQLFEGAIEGMVAVLDDDYSEYLNEEHYRWLLEDTEGSFVGVGITILLNDNGNLQIVSTLDGSPADRSRLLPGDILVAVDGFGRNGMTLSQAVRRIKGEKGKPVTLIVRHPGATEEDSIALVRDQIAVESVSDAAIVDPVAGTGYLRITTFADRTGSEVRQALERLIDAGAKSVIIDLRNNPGGSFKACREVIDLFLSDGVMVSTRDRAEKTTQSYDANDDNSLVDDDFPIVVLINDGSASASEVVAAALQDRSRARLVGTHSFGKGSVQEIIPIGKDAKTALKLTTSHWIRPSGEKTTPNDPVQPDVEVTIADAVWKELIRHRREGEAYRRPDWLAEDPVDEQLQKAKALLAPQTED